MLASDAGHLLAFQQQGVKHMITHFYLRGGERVTSLLKYLFQSVKKRSVIFPHIHEPTDERARTPPLKHIFHFLKQKVSGSS